MIYRYGMRLRGFSPLCQPMDGLIKCVKIPEASLRLWDRYFDVLEYNRPLTDEELSDYGLDDLQREYYIITDADGNVVNITHDWKIKRLRVCPCCSYSYSEEPQPSKEIDGMLICPDCQKRGW